MSGNTNVFWPGFHFKVPFVFCCNSYFLNLPVGVPNTGVVWLIAGLKTSIKVLQIPTPPAITSSNGTNTVGVDSNIAVG